LDADDVLHLDCLKHRINQINQFPHFSFWVFPIGTFYTNIGDSKSKWIPKGKDHLQKFLSHNMPWHTMSVIWQREFVTRLNGFDPEYPRLQDVELHTRALLRNNISYKTFPECTPDAWYRIDGHRTAQNLEKQLLNQWLGIQMYIQKTYPILNKNKYKAALKGTLISFINSINYHCIVNAKKITLHKELLKDISLFLKKECVFHNIDLYYINTYIQLYKAGLWKIKGFNYLMKKIFYTYSLFLQNK